MFNSTDVGRDFRQGAKLNRLIKILGKGKLVADLFRSRLDKCIGRIGLDLVLKKELGKAIDWSMVDKEDYLLAMERSPIRDTEIKYVLRSALVDDTGDRELFMKGVDHSYYYEGYNLYKTSEL